MFGGSTNIAPDSPAVFGQLYAGDDSIIPYFRQLADRVHAHGAATMVQLTHMGRRTIWDAGDWLPTIAPSSVREPSHRSFPKEMDDGDIRRVVRAFADAARRAKEGGLDGVEVIAYGHLVDQFWSPLVNRRTDRYGGSLENRMRFSMEVLDAIRGSVGDDFIVGIRMTAEEDVEGGLTRDEGLAIAGGLARAGLVDFINVIRGWIATDESLARVIPGIGSPIAPHLAFAGAIKEAVDVPVFHAARVPDLPTARFAVSEGLVDMIGMTRAHMADPHIVAKLQAGEEDRIRPCVGATYCLNRIYLGGDALCIHNPATGREATIPQLVTPSDEPGKRVVVVGGGVAGLEAARVSAERGHRVVLLEANAELGGQVVLASRATERRRDLIGIVDWLVSECRRAGVDLRTGVLASAEDVLGLDPEIVVVATGGWPRVPEMSEGADLVLTTWDIVSGSARPASSVLLFDDHGTEDALSCAERMAAAGSAVELVTPDRHVGQEVPGTMYPPYLTRLYEYGVVMTPDHRLRAVRRHGGRLEAELWNDYSKTVTTRTVDQVVVENGTEPILDVFVELVDGSLNGGRVDVDEYIGLRPQTLIDNPDGEYRLFRVGDAVSSRNIHASIYEARRVCMVL
jgi:2,4-dienoyl-CoA reductase-like NADH-dependent reductase (Old Yellow Enzyme family)/thioredoxin reductase